MRTTSKVVSVLLVALLLVAARAQGDPRDLATYEPPYAEGSSGGDSSNLLHSDDEGRIVVARAHPRPSFLSCAAYAGWQNFRITHEATEAFGNVRIALADVVVDPYTFLSVSVHDAAGEFIGSAKVRGPLTALEHGLDVPITWNGDGFEPQTVQLEFGLELTSACPSADAGTARFTAVTLQDQAHSHD